MSEDFRDRAIKHLSMYKENVLLVEEKGLYNGHEYAHILPERIKMRNIISAGVENLILKRELSLHRNFAHLNSSQAMCINFFAPLFKSVGADRKLFPSLINDVLNIPVHNAETVTSCFEHLLQGDEKMDSTNFDLFVRLDNGIRIFFEIKYTEQEFGRGKKTSTKYDLLLKRSKCLVKLGDDLIRETESGEVHKHFYKYYQLYRNVMHIETESDYAVFIYPKDNSRLVDELDRFRNDNIYCCNSENIKYFTWEELYEKSLLHLTSNDKYVTYYKLFYEKYLNL